MVEYTDGSTRSVPVRFTDWTPGTDHRFGGEPLVTTTGRNRAAGGPDTVETKAFATRPEPLKPQKRVAAAVLPQGTDRGVMHVFDVALTDRPDLEFPGLST